MYEAKISFYRRDLAIPYRRVRVCVSDNDNTKIMLAILRIIVADKEDFDMLVSCSGSSIYRSIRDAQIAISLTNEYRAMTLLKSICDSYLSKYPCTYDEDCARLRENKLAPFSNERHAVIQVKGEKEVLLFLKDWAVTACELLQANDMHQFDEQLEDIRCRKHSLIYQYCRSIISRLLQDEIRRIEIRRRNVDLSRPTVV